MENLGYVECTFQGVHGVTSYRQHQNQTEVKDPTQHKKHSNPNKSKLEPKSDGMDNYTNCNEFSQPFRIFSALQFQQMQLISVKQILINFMSDKSDNQAGGYCTKKQAKYKFLHNSHYCFNLSGSSSIKHLILRFSSNS